MLGSFLEKMVCFLRAITTGTQNLFWTDVHRFDIAISVYYHSCR